MTKTRWLWLAAPVLLGCSGATTDSPQITAVADVPQLMLTVLEPAAEVYWDAVGSILDESGTHDFAPETDEEWEAVRKAAYVIAESGNLLMMGDRALDDGAWMAMAAELTAIGRRAIEVAEARDSEGVFDMGAEVYYVCTNCHSSYAIETLRPSDERSENGDDAAGNQ